MCDPILAKETVRLENQILCYAIMNFLGILMKGEYFGY